MAIKVVTDSTSDLPQELADSMGIEIVPLKVRFGDEEFRDGVDISADEFYKRLIDGPLLPTTSQPSVGEFIEVYERLGGDADGIVSVHVSSKVSGTYNAALQAKTQVSVDCPIEVIDSLQASMGLGMVALAAAKEARQGAGMDKVAEATRRAMAQCRFFVLLDTLEYLEKGGRIGKARAFVGTLLSIKPLISVTDGEVHEFGKERTRSRAVARLQRTARELAPVQELSVLYSTSSDDAYSMAQNLRDLLPEGKEPLVARAGPVIGTYAGPGALGIVVLRAESSGNA